MGIQTYITDLFVTIRPKLINIMMKNTLSGDERFELIKDLFYTNKVYQIVHQAKTKEINDIYIEHLEIRHKSASINNKQNRNIYDYTFPNLSENLKLKDYKKYKFESRVLSYIDNINPHIELSNEVGVLIQRLNPRVRTIPEHFYKDVLYKYDISKNVSKTFFSRRRSNNSIGNNITNK